jgi:uncharacterized protein YcnI
MFYKLSCAIFRRTAAVTIFAAFCAPAFAHVTLEQHEARVGASYKAVFKVPHGCDGSPTVRIRVHIPEGVISVKPMVKPGWTIAVKRGPYTKPYSFLHGAKFTEGPTEITWSGGNLPDAYYDEFVLSTFLAGELPAGGMLYFPVDQECEKGAHHWNAVPENGKAIEGDPAPGIRLLPKAKAHGG